MQIRHDGELPHKHDAMTTRLVVAPSTAGSIEIPKDKLRFPDAVDGSQALIQLTDLLLALIERSSPGIRFGEDVDSPQGRRAERDLIIEHFNNGGWIIGAWHSSPPHSTQQRHLICNFAAN